MFFSLIVHKTIDYDYQSSIRLGSTLSLRCRRRPALANDPNTRKDQHHSQSLLPGEVIQTDDDADDGGDDGLHVVVHADQSGSQALLPDGDEEIGDKSGEEHHVGYLPRYAGFYLSQRDVNQTLDVERQRHQHGEQEHPLHEGDHVVFRDERTEDAEIKGEGERVDDGQHDAHGLGLGGAATQSHRVENQQQDTRQTHQDTSDFLPRDGLFQEDGRHQHCQDGRAGVGDAHVDGSRQSDGFQEAPLCEKESQHGGHEDLQEVLCRHLFLGHEERQKPKQQRGTRRTEA